MPRLQLFYAAPALSKALEVMAVEAVTQMKKEGRNPNDFFSPACVGQLGIS